MRIACSGLPINLSEYNTTPHNGDGTRDHAMVYPFKVSLPRYASWRVCVRTILKQLKSCEICRAAADAFPISSLPKVHKLPDGKVLVFKSLTCSTTLENSSPEATSLHELDTVHDGVEEFDMVSIDPNCPKHGKYSLTAWLRMEGMTMGGVNVRARSHQLAPSAREIKKFCIGKRINKCTKKSDGVDKSISPGFWKPLDNFYLHMLDKDIVEKPSQIVVPSTLKECKCENLEPVVLKHIETITTTKPSVLSQRQSNNLPTNNQDKDSILKNPKNTKRIYSKLKLKKSSTNMHYIRETFPLESNIDNEMSDNTSEKIEVNCRHPSGPSTSHLVNKGCGKGIQTYASQHKKICQIKELNKKFVNICDEAVQCARDDEMRQPNMKTSMEGKMPLIEEECIEQGDENLVASNLEEYLKHHTITASTTFVEAKQTIAKNTFDLKEEQREQWMECVQHENGKLFREKKLKVERDESSTQVQNEFITKEKQTRSDIFDTKELEQTSQRLEKIANTTKTLQLELENSPPHLADLFEDFHLTKGHAIKNKIQQWFSNMAIERAIEYPLETFESGRVRRLVQAFESIK